MKLTDELISIKKLVEEIYLPNVDILQTSTNNIQNNKNSDEYDYLLLVQNVASQFYYINSIILNIFLYKKNKIKPTREKFNLNNTINDLTKLFEPYTIYNKAFKIKSSCFFDYDLSFIESDKQKLEQILFVLLQSCLTNISDNKAVHLGYEYSKEYQQIILFVGNSRMSNIEKKTKQLLNNKETFTESSSPLSMNEYNIISILTNIIGVIFYYEREDANFYIVIPHSIKSDK